MIPFILAAAAAATPAEPPAPEGVVAKVQAWWSSVTFSWFDIVVIALLVVGFIHGKKRGMSGELVDLMAALAMVVVAGDYHKPASAFITQFSNLAPQWANLVAYIGIIFGIASVVGVVKNKMGSKLVSGDLFGRAEYYLGALAGVVRYGCYVVIGITLINSKIASVAEAEEAKAKQIKEVGSTFIPSPVEIHVAIVHKSFVSTLVKDVLEEKLIDSTSYSGPATITPEAPAWKGKENDPTKGIQ